MNNKSIFVIGSWPDNKIKERNLINVVRDLKSKGYPICLVTHYPVSEEVQELVDYYIYEKENVLSDNWRLTFWRMHNGEKQERLSKVDYHGVACLMSIRNAIDLLLAKGQYKYIHYREADLEYDFDLYMDLFRRDLIDHDASALFIHYQDGQYRTDLFSCDIKWYDTLIPRCQSWAEYKESSISGNLILEYWFSEHVNQKTTKEDIVFVENFTVSNKWTQADCVDWDIDPRPKLDLAAIPINNIDFSKALELLYNTKKQCPNIVELCEHNDITKNFAHFISKYGGSYFGCCNDDDCLLEKKQILRSFINNNDMSNIVTLTRKEFDEFLKKYDNSIDLIYVSSHGDIYQHLMLVLRAIEKTNINGFIMFNKSYTSIFNYLNGSDNFTCVYKGEYFIFRRDI